MAVRAIPASADTSSVGIRNQGFRAPQVCAVVGITYRQLDYWARTDLVIPSLRGLGAGAGRLYSFEDLVTLKVIKRLLDAGMSLRRIRDAVDALRPALQADPLPDQLTLLSEGDRVHLVSDAEDLVEILGRGRGVFGIAIGPVLDQLVLDLARRGNVPADDRSPEGFEIEETPFVSQVLERIRDRLVDVEREYAAGGRTLAVLGGADDVAARLLAWVPEPSPWDLRLGPFYSSAKVAALLGDVSRQAVADRRKRGTLLAAETTDGVLVYPTWQFTDDGQVNAWVPTVVQPFAAHGIDGWDVAGWLTSTFKALSGATPLQYLQTGGDPAIVRDLADRAAARLAA